MEGRFKASHFLFPAVLQTYRACSLLCSCLSVCFSIGFVCLPLPSSVLPPLLFPFPFLYLLFRLFFFSIHSTLPSSPFPPARFSTRLLVFLRRLPRGSRDLRGEFCGHERFGGSSERPGRCETSLSALLCVFALCVASHAGSVAITGSPCSACFECDVCAECCKWNGLNGLRGLNGLNEWHERCERCECFECY